MSLNTERFAAKRGLYRLAVAVLAAVLLAASGCATGGGPSPKEIAEAEQDKDQRRAQAHYKIAIEYLREGNPSLAIRELQTSIHYDDSNAWSHLSIAEAYRLKGLPKMAQDSLERALRIKPDFQQARLTLSALLVQKGEYQAAIDQTDKLLSDPTFPVPWQALTNKGYAELKLGLMDAARESLTLALEYHPSYWQAHLNLGILEARSGNLNEALQRFEQVLTVRPGLLAESEVNYRMGEIYVSLGNQALAMDHLVAAASNRPSGPWGKRSEDYLKSLK